VFRGNDGLRLVNGNELFKMGVKGAMINASENRSSRDFTALSTQYQVLHKSTAMVGIVKQ